MSREQWGHGYSKGLKDGIKARTSFKYFCIAMYAGEDSPKGDFAYDLQRDPEFPSSGNATKKDMKCHLIRMGACGAAMDIFKELFKEWKNTKKEN